jgi:hypothetical protein
MKSRYPLGMNTILLIPSQTFFFRSKELCTAVLRYWELWAQGLDLGLFSSHIAYWYDILEWSFFGLYFFTNHNRNDSKPQLSPAYLFELSYACRILDNPYSCKVHLGEENLDIFDTESKVLRTELLDHWQLIVAFDTVPLHAIDNACTLQNYLSPKHVLMLNHKNFAQF